MNPDEIKPLEKELWNSADNLRVNSKLTAAEYKATVLGLILLRYAQNRLDETKIAIEASYQNLAGILFYKVLWPLTRMTVGKSTPT